MTPNQVAVIDLAWVAAGIIIMVGIGYAIYWWNKNKGEGVADDSHEKVMEDNER
jgi:hypothetical protein